MLDASRVSGLAVLWVASLAIAKSKEAARLLRAAEGLVRSATAVLQASQTSPRDGARREPSLARNGGGDVHKEEGKDKSKCRSKRGKSRTGKRGDWKCQACGAHCFGSKAQCYKCGTARPGAGAMEVEPPASHTAAEIDDLWADGVASGGGAAGGAVMSVAAAASTAPASATTIPRRVLAPHGSSERSPRGVGDATLKFSVGASVTLHGLGTRFDLNGSKGVVASLPGGEADPRYCAQLDGKDEQLRVKPCNLKPLAGPPPIFS